MSSRASWLRGPAHSSLVARTAALGVAGALVLAGCSAGRDTGQTAQPSATGASTSAPQSSTGSTGTGSSTGTATQTASPTAAPTTSSAGVAVGEVVEGFPLDVVPVLPDAEVTLSNVVPDGPEEGAARTVTLAGRTAQPAEAVVAFYTQALTANGFTVTTPAPVEGAQVLTFTRGAEAADLLTLSVTGAQGQQDFTIGGRLA